MDGGGQEPAGTTPCPQPHIDRLLQVGNQGDLPLHVHHGVDPQLTLANRSGGDLSAPEQDFLFIGDLRTNAHPQIYLFICLEDQAITVVLL